MQKKDITLTFEDEKLDALEFSLKKKGSSVQRRMQEALKGLYEQGVAAPVRETWTARPRLPPSPGVPSSRPDRRRQGLPLPLRRRPK